VDRETFLRTLALENRTRRPAEPRKADRDTGAKTADQRPLVMLDPGHGGIDNGTVAPSGENEKAIVLDFALMLRDKLEKTGKYRVAMTRSDDRFVALADRVRLARAQAAALFISIHADALAKHEGEARGAAVYTLSETASDAEAARLADYLHARTEGNALFVGELLRALAEQGVVLQEDGGWQLGDLSGIAVPPLLRQVIDGRVARLDGEAQRLLTVAAVVGQAVPPAAMVRSPLRRVSPQNRQPSRRSIQTA